MSAASPIVSRTLIAFIAVVSLALSYAGTSPSVTFARQGDAPVLTADQSAGEITGLMSDLTSDVRALQSILSAMGHYPHPMSGSMDQSTAAALESFQRAYGLPVTGELDELTLVTLGGSPQDLNRRPRFHYTVRGGDTLTGIARRFESSIPWILRLNPTIGSMNHIAQGMQLVVPIRFPIPDDFRVERVQVLADRFLGTYVTDIPYTDAHRLEEQIVEALQQEGFATERGATALDGTTLKGRGVILGKLVFRAQQSNGRTRVDVALLFNEATPH